MLLADLSEFVYFTDAQAYAAGHAPDGTPYDVVILRVSYSNYHVDAKLQSNLTQARNAGLLVLFYFYLEQGVDPASQGTFFAQTLQSVGGLQPGEGIFCDCEEGSGDLTPNVEAALAAAHAVLGDPVTDEGVYSGASFFATHLGTTPSGYHRWIASYGTPNPGEGEVLWQFTDTENMPGISAPCDCSIFTGTLAQLKALFGAGAPVNEEDHMTKLVQATNPASNVTSQFVIRCSDVLYAPDATTSSWAYQNCNGGQGPLEAVPWEVILWWNHNQAPTGAP